MGDEKKNVFDDALARLNELADISGLVESTYKAAKVRFDEIDAKYRELRGLSGPGGMDLSKIKKLITDNKGTLMAVAAAFGLPVGLADSGAFSTITGLFGKLGGLFGIG